MGFVPFPVKRNNRPLEVQDGGLVMEIAASRGWLRGLVCPCFAMSRASMRVQPGQVIGVFADTRPFDTWMDSDGFWLSAKELACANSISPVGEGAAKSRRVAEGSSCIEQGPRRATVWDCRPKITAANCLAYSSCVRPCIPSAVASTPLP
jgi:hypothetical protein